MSHRTGFIVNRTLWYFNFNSYNLTSYITYQGADVVLSDDDVEMSKPAGVWIM